MIQERDWRHGKRAIRIKRCCLAETRQQSRAIIEQGRSDHVKRAHTPGAGKRRSFLPKGSSAREKGATKAEYITRKRRLVIAFAKRVAEEAPEWLRDIADSNLQAQVDGASDAGFARQYDNMMRNKGGSND